MDNHLLPAKQRKKTTVESGEPPAAVKIKKTMTEGGEPSATVKRKKTTRRERHKKINVSSFNGCNTSTVYHATGTCPTPFVGKNFFLLDKSTKRTGKEK